MSASIERPPPARAAEALNRAVLGDHLRRVLWMLEIDCVLDVGAYLGDYASFLRGLGYRGRIVSFEPVLEQYQQLARASAADPLWIAERLALGQRAGERPINVARARHFSSFLSPSAFGLEEFAGLSEVERTEAVSVERLDRYLGAAGSELAAARTLLKLDAQGSDLEILEGAGDRLDEFAAVQIEAPVQAVYEEMPTYDDLVSRLRAGGFELTALVPVTRDRCLRLVELDCVMVRRRSR